MPKKLEMNYCMQCGTKLEMRMHPQEETEVAYCPTCEAFRHPIYNTAVSMVVQNQSRDRFLLIQQYGRPSYILVAGYINRGEDAEDAVRREVMEETGLTVETVTFPIRSCSIFPVPYGIWMCTTMKKWTAGSGSRKRAHWKTSGPTHWRNSF